MPIGFSSKLHGIVSQNLFVNGKKVLLLDPMGTDVLRQTVITKFYALSPIFDNFCLSLSVVLKLSFFMNGIRIFEEQYS